MSEIRKKDLFSGLNYPNRRIENCGRFEVVLPEVFGFCGGVIHALKLLEETIISNPDKKLFLLGEIIHNTNVNEYFQAKGVNILPHNVMEQIFSVAAADDIIIIPAFGIGINLESRIRKHFKTVIDTTCKDVKRVWEFVREESSKGATILIHGHPNHPEVEATISRASFNSAIIVIPNLKSAELFADFFRTRKSLHGISKEIYVINGEKFNTKRIALANQTTMLFNETVEIETILKKTLEQFGCTFVACQTICKATYNRQTAALRLLGKENPDIVFVVGGYGSSNTNNLYFLANQVCSTFYIKDSSSIKEDGLEHYIPSKNKTTFSILSDVFSSVKKIAILAGASCPVGIVNSLVERLKYL